MANKTFHVKGFMSVFAHSGTSFTLNFEAERNTVQLKIDWRGFFFLNICVCLRAAISFRFNF